MFKFFKKEKDKSDPIETLHLNWSLPAVLAYEVARSDGEISKDELSILMLEIENAEKVGRDKNEIWNIVDAYSKDSISFHEFIEDINKNYSKDQKKIFKNSWQTAFADGKLDVDEEKLVSGVADLIKIKDVEV